MIKSSFAIILTTFCSLTWATPDLNKAAGDVCECLKEPYKQVQKAMEMLQSAQTSGDMSALASAQGEMMGVMNASNLCFENLSKKYPEIDKRVELQEKVMNLADKQCPNPATAMSANR